MSDGQQDRCFGWPAGDGPAVGKRADPDIRPEGQDGAQNGRSATEAAEQATLVSPGTPVPREAVREPLRRSVEPTPLADTPSDLLPAHIAGDTALRRWRQKLTLGRNLRP